jgi:hypothetical protein
VANSTFFLFQSQVGSFELFQIIRRILRLTFADVIAASCRKMEARSGTGPVGARQLAGTIDQKSIGLHIDGW